MRDEYITLTELALLLGLFGTPSYLVVSGAVLLWMKRAGVWGRGYRRRLAVAFAAALIVAVPLTLLLWAASGYLPSVVTQLLTIDHDPLSFLSTVSLPAFIAAGISFPIAGWILTRRSRPVIPERGT